MFFIRFSSTDEISHFISHLSVKMDIPGVAQLFDELDSRYFFLLKL